MDKGEGQWDSGMCALIGMVDTYVPTYATCHMSHAQESFPLFRTTAYMYVHVYVHMYICRVKALMVLWWRFGANLVGTTKRTLQTGVVG